MLRFLRLPGVMNRFAIGATSVYAKTKQGLLTSPIKLTKRSSAWPEHEIDAIAAAMIRGDSEEELRTVVRQLMEARRSALPVQVV